MTRPMGVSSALAAFRDDEGRRERDDAFVSVVVPCLNEERHLRDLFEALSAQRRRPDEVVVVEGGSTDGSADILRTYAASPTDFEVRLLERPGGSIPENVNAGVTAARGDVIVRLDAHAIPSKNYIADALVHLQDPAVGVVGGVWRVAASAAGPSARAIARAVSHPLGAGDAKYRIGGGLKAPMTVDTVPFGCFQRDLWRELGGFDEYLHTNEDYDFNYRARQSGRCVFLDPRIRSTYFARPTLRALATQYLRYGWWKAQMLRKYPESLRWRQAVPATFVALTAVLALAGLIWPRAWFLLGVMLSVHAATVLATSVALAARTRDWAALPGLIGAFFVIHFVWGTGFLLNMLTLARWPYTVTVSRPDESPSSVV